MYGQGFMYTEQSWNKDNQSDNRLSETLAKIEREKMKARRSSMVDMSELKALKVVAAQTEAMNRRSSLTTNRMTQVLEKYDIKLPDGRTNQRRTSVVQVIEEGVELVSELEEEPEPIFTTLTLYDNSYTPTNNSFVDPAKPSSPEIVRKVSRSQSLIPPPRRSQITLPRSMSLAGALNVNPIEYARFCYNADKLSQQSTDMRKNLKNLENKTPTKNCSVDPDKPVTPEIKHNFGGDMNLYLREQSAYNRRGSSGSMGSRVEDEEQQIPWEDYTQPHLFQKKWEP